MPLTKDLNQAMESYSDDELDRLGDHARNSGNESDGLVGDHHEQSDLERTLAQKSIRRSVVREKLNWSQ